MVLYLCRKHFAKLYTNTMMVSTCTSFLSRLNLPWILSWTGSEQSTQVRTAKGSHQHSHLWQKNTILQLNKTLLDTCVLKCHPIQPPPHPSTEMVPKHMVKCYDFGWKVMCVGVGGGDKFLREKNDDRFMKIKILVYMNVLYALQLLSTGTTEKQYTTVVSAPYPQNH